MRRIRTAEDDPLGTGLRGHKKPVGSLQPVFLCSEISRAELLYGDYSSVVLIFDELLGILL